MQNNRIANMQIKIILTNQFPYNREMQFETDWCVMKTMFKFS